MNSARRPNSNAARDIAHQIHAYTDLRKHEREGPLVIVRGEGVHVYDDQGRKYIEGLAGLWSTSLGFSEQRLADAAYEQMKKLPTYHVFAHKSHEPSIEAAERLLAIAPKTLSKVLFANSGSEANDTAMKIVRYYNNARGRPEKKKIISRVRGYHGVTIAAASLTRMPYVQNDFDLPIPGVIYTSCPHHYRYAAEDESEDAFAARLAEELETLILEEGPETVAAFIGEPVQGAGGVVVPPMTYWPRVQEVLRKHDVLLIADEVICGFGRTGEMFGCDTFGIQPDMLTCAKALSSAYLPISAVLVSDGIYQVIADNSAKHGNFGHGFTYSGHPVAAAVAVETLKIYEEIDIVAQVKRVAPRLQEGLRRFEGRPLVGEVRGIGLIAAVELVADRAKKTAFDPVGKVGGYMFSRCQEHGLIVRNLGDSIALCPPLIISEAEIDELLARFDRALADTEAWVKAEGLAKVA